MTDNNQKSREQQNIYKKIKADNTVMIAHRMGKISEYGSRKERECYADQTFRFASGRMQIGISVWQKHEPRQNDRHKIKYRDLPQRGYQRLPICEPPPAAEQTSAWYKKAYSTTNTELKKNI